MDYFNIHCRPIGSYLINIIFEITESIITSLKNIKILTMKTLFTLFCLTIAFYSNSQPGCNWAYAPIGTGFNPTNIIHNVVVDAGGNIIEAGILTGIADMDPGTGAGDTAFTSYGYNYYLAKYTSTGSLLWIKYFKSYGTFVTFDFTGLAINSAGDIIVSGNFIGGIDFDLSDAGIDTLRSHFFSYSDYFVAKYDAQGNYYWAFNIGDTQNDLITARTLTLLPNDNIVVAAEPNGQVDVDPGPNVHYCIQGNADLICYDSNGNYLWDTNNYPANYSYAQYEKTIDCDSSGNIYLMSVGYYELTVTKFSNTGTKLWGHKIGEFLAQARVTPQSILVDKATGDFYVSGTFEGAVDFDPGAGVLTMISTSWNYQDGFIAKYDSAMHPLWVNQYAGKVEFGNYSLDFSNGDIVAVGKLQGPINFGNGINLISSGPTVFSPFYIKLTASGIIQNGYALTGSGAYLTINNMGNQMYLTTGSVQVNTDMDPGTPSLLIQGNCSGFTAIYSSITSAIEETTEQNMFTVYPNPANDIVCIPYPNISQVSENENVLLQLFDVNGKEVLTQLVNSDQTNILNVSTLPAGIYLLKMADQISKICVFH